jgi:hypothetical protein
VPNGFAATTSTELGAAPAEPHLFGEPDSAKDRALRWDPLLACGGGWRPPIWRRIGWPWDPPPPAPEEARHQVVVAIAVPVARAATIHQEHANARPAGLATDFRS